jgi:hypothetical protein
MPRELYLVSPRPVIIEAFVLAAARVDDQLAMRAIYGGAALQLVDEAEVAVLTLENSRLLVDASDAARCAPGLVWGAVPHQDVWWTESTAPWDAAGDPGVAVLRELAEILDGQLRVEDGR